MSETFYTALDVATDASREAITRAYREKVKIHHPDVSDDPASPRTFRRLTTARDVLVDEDERARYDGLGHAVYVHRHLDSDVWETESASPGRSRTGSTAESHSRTARPKSGTNGPDGRTAGSGSGTAGSARSTAGNSRDSDAHGGAARDPAGTASGTVGGPSTGEERWGWLGEDRDPSARDARQRDRRRREQRYRSYHGTDGGDWGQASPMYTRRPTGGSERGPSRGRSTVDTLRQIGPWLGVHVIFISSAIATGLFTFTGAGGVLHLSLAQYAVAAILSCLLVLTSVLHLVSVLFSR